MLTLAFESSAKAASVALCEDGRLISQVIRNSETEMKQIDCFAVAQGPGSFTGIRIGIATVKGLAWAADKPCIGVSTLAAMAWNGVAAGGLICAVMDARRSEVYNALFRIEDGRPVRLCPDRAISLSALTEELRERGEAPFLVGDGTELASAFFREQHLEHRVPPENLRWQNAWGVAMEAAGKELCTSQELLPVYLRLSQAERVRQARLSRNTNR